MKVLERAPKGVWTDSPLVAPRVPTGFKSAREWAGEWGICYRAASAKLGDRVQRGEWEVLRAPGACGLGGATRMVYMYRPRPTKGKLC